MSLRNSMGALIVAALNPFMQRERVDAFETALRAIVGKRLTYKMPVQPGETDTKG